MENNVPEVLCKERRKTTDEHFKRVDERLRLGEEKIDTVEKAVVLLTEMTKQNKKDIEEHDERIKTVEQRPNVWMDRLVGWAGSAAIGGLVGLAFKLFS